MNKNFIDTMNLFSCGARGIEPEIKGYDFKEIYKIAVEQGVWDTVFLSLSRIYKKNPELISEDIFAKLNTEFMKRCAKQYRRLDFIHKLIKTLNENEIETCILKGETIARFYHTPVARASSDVDILINSKKLDNCLQILKENGFAIGEVVFDSHQVECTHPVAGLVEIHIMMYGKRTEDVCFNNEVKYDEPHITVAVEDGTMLETLGTTDNFLYLFLHFVKHFLYLGAGIRQMYDLLLFVEKNYAEIDWIRSNNSIEALGFKKFFEGIIAIGKKYAHFPEDLFIEYTIKDSLVERIFADMEGGGVFGFDDQTRGGFYNLYLERRSQKFNNGSYEKYKNKRKFHKLFPKREFMAKSYPYVEKSVILLPAAWIHRIIKGIMPKKKTPISAEHKERLDMLKDLEMI